jgi:hypothetical protein
MKKMLSGFLSVLMVVGLGVVLYQRLNPSMKQTSQSPAAVPIPAGPAELPDAADRLPPVPDTAGGFAAVNEQRLATLAGQPYKGPSYKEDYEGAHRQMMAKRAQNKDRLPASDADMKKTQKNPKK